MLSEKDVAQVKKRINLLAIKKWGLFFYYLLPFRKKIIQENIKIVFTNQLTIKEQKKLAILAYGHLLSCVYEITRSLLFRKSNMDALKILGLERVLAEVKKNNNTGVVLLTGHFGAFETAPVQAIKQKKEFRNSVFIVRKTLTNKWVQKLLFGHYQQAGIQVIPKKNAVWTVMDKLEQGNIIVLVMDQFTAVGKNGVAANFFGKPSGTFKLPAKLAQYTKSLVVPMKLYYDNDGQHTLEFYESIPWIENADAHCEIKFNTEQYNKVMERFVLEHPEQWFWLHRRWKGCHIYP